MTRVSRRLEPQPALRARYDATYDGVPAAPPGDRADRPRPGGGVGVTGRRAGRGHLVATDVARRVPGAAIAAPRRPSPSTA